MADPTYMKLQAKPAFDRLAEALDETVPDCHDDARYIADTNRAADKQEMGAICAACPLLDLCTDFALTDRPPGGWWPGFNLKIERKDAAA